MAEIRLREYLTRIEEMLDDQHLHEAVAHCRHILSVYPQHVPTYRLMAKAYLEQGEYLDATEIFQRVLSADPEDFVAHVGMAIAYKEDGLIAQAAWHMERAFEIEPYNPVVRDELMALYGMRDEEEPERLMLNRAALARLYLRSGMDELAVVELEYALREESPERIDLQVLLAEAQWRAGQRVDAVDASLTLLEQLPNCLKANAILSTAWLESGRLEEAEAHLERLQSLMAPEEDLAGAPSLVAAPLARERGRLPAAVKVEWLEYVPEILPETPDDEVPDWVEELNFSTIPSTSVDLDEVEEEFIDEPPEPPAPRSDEDVPSWLRDIAAEEGGSPTGWLQEIAAGDSDMEAIADLASDPEDDVPEWLTDILDESEKDPAAFGTGELYDFLADEESQLAENPLAEDTASDLPVIGNEKPFVEPDVAPSEPATSTSEETDADVDPELMAWLADDVTAEEQIMPMNDNPELQPDPEDRDEQQPQDEFDDALDWLEALSGAGSEADGEDDAENALPDWLQGDVVGDVSDETVPDWLQEETSEAAQSSPSPTAPLSAGGEESQEDVADEEEEDLSWLDAIASGAGPAVEEPPTLSWDTADDAESAVPEASADSDATAQEGGVDEAMSWLEEFAEAGVDQEEGSSDAEEDFLTGPVDSQSEIFSGGDVELPAGSPPDDDLDEAMNWLEELSSDVDELTPPPPESDQKTEVMPDEVLAAEDALDEGESMAWLDELTPADQQPDAQADEQEVTPDMETEVFEDETFAEDEDMSWLDELADSGADAADAAVTPEEPTPPWLQALEAEADSQIFDLEDTFVDSEERGTGMLAGAEGADDSADGEEQPAEDVTFAEPAAAAESPPEPVEKPASSTEAEADESIAAASSFAAETGEADLDWLDDLMDESELEPGPDAESIVPVEEMPTAPSMPLVPAVTDEQLEELLAADAAGEETPAAEVESETETEEEDVPQAADATVLRSTPVMIDGQEVTDLDIESTDDPVDEDDALSWLEELVSEATEEAEAVDAETRMPGLDEIRLEEEPAPPPQAAEPAAEAPTPDAEPEEEAADEELPAPGEAAEEAVAMESAQVVVDGQVVPDLDIEATEDPLDEDDALSWLADLMGESGEAASVADELEELTADESQPEAEAEEEAPEVSAVEAAEVLEVEPPIPPVAEIDEERPLGELADDDEMAEAMAWLEELMADTDESELSAVEEDAEADVSVEAPAAAEVEAEPEAPVAEEAPEETAFVTEPAADESEVSDEIAGEADELESLADEIPEDPDEALRWLESMSDEEDVVAEEDDMAWLDALGEAEDAEEEPAGEISLEEFSAATGDVPQWLEEAAEEEGVDLAVPEPPDEVEPLAIDEVMEAFEPEPMDDQSETEAPEFVEEEPEAPAVPITSELDPDSFVSRPPDAGEEALDLELDEDPVTAALPDWLLEDDSEDSMSWMEELNQSSVTRWLSAEEEASIHSGVLESDVVEGTPEPVDTGELSGETVEEVPAPPVAEEPAVAFETMAPSPEMDADLLDRARSQLQERDYDQVLESYNALLDSGQGIEILVNDLEQASSVHREPRLVRLLGDAYMREGQLQKAIDTYRHALDLM